MHARRAHRMRHGSGVVMGSVVVMSTWLLLAASCMLVDVALAVSSMLVDEHVASSTPRPRVAGGRSSSEAAGGRATK